MTLLRGTRSSAELAQWIRGGDYSHESATVVGYGNMGRHYLQALRALGVENIRLCSRSAGALAELQGQPGITVFSGGYENLQITPRPGELAIVATPTVHLVRAATFLLESGFKNLLIEKPVALRPAEIEGLAAAVEAKGARAACAYNRLAYPSFHEVQHRSTADGGITSCHYTFTEFVDRIGPDQFQPEDLRRWGIANSLHVLSMAHGLIGLPQTTSAFRNGAISWHPSGAVFVGAGISDRSIPFTYHANWGSTERWSVELHTAGASYRLCPLETVSRRTSFAGQWESLPLSSFSPSVKAGLAEEVAAMFKPETSPIKLPDLRQAAELTRFAEKVFGYGE
jgi:predicted dehydrogenase